MSNGRAAVGHPVDVATGTLFNYYQDFALRGRISLAFVRYYSTALIANGQGVLGFGFRHNYQHELRQSLEGFVYIDFEGNEHDLLDDGSFATTGKLIFPGKTLELSGSPDQIELRDYSRASKPVLRFVRRQGSRHYDLTSVVAHRNNRLDLSYDAAHRLQTVTQSRTGHVLEFNYDAGGRITEVMYRAGVRDLVSAFHYDINGDLATVSDPAGTTAVYQYDQHRMTSESVRGGSTHEFRYDVSGRCISASGPNNYEARQLQFDDAARTTFVSDSKGATESYEYNAGGQIIRFTDALGRSSVSSYDALGRLESWTDASGAKRTHHYDPLGHLSKVDYPDKTSFGLKWTDDHNLVSAIDPTGLVWQYAYDADGLMVRSENPQGRVHSYSFDDYGQVLSVTTPTGASYRYTYDQRGYLVGFSSAQGATTRRVVDARGNELSTINALGSATRCQYDTFDRLVEFVDSSGRSWRYFYDTQGRLSQVYFPGGDHIEYEYNTCGLVLATKRADGSVLRCDWDTEPGRILALHDSNGNSLRYQYDAVGRVQERTNWDGVVTKFEYDEVGRVAAIIPTTGARQEFSYNPMGLVTQRRTGDVEVNFEYDINGFMLAAIGPDHSVRWERDLYGRALSETQDGHRVEYEFDEMGRRSSMQTALGETVEYQYNLASQLERLALGKQQIEFDYSVTGEEVARRFSGGGRFDRQYDNLGRLTREWFTPPRGVPASGQTPGVDPVSVSREYSYAPLSGVLERIRDSLRGGTQLAHDSLGQLRAVIRYFGYAEYYDYDLSGNRKTTARLSAAAPPIAASVFGPTFGAQGMDQATLTALGADIETRALGPGNRTVTLHRASASIFYEFDGDGFLRQKSVSSLGSATEIWKYEWNPEGQLGSVTLPDGTLFSYEYDPLGRRVKKVGPKGSVRYVWEHRRLLHVLEEGQPPITMVNDPVAIDPLLRKRGDETHFVLPDQIGSISELVDEKGVLGWWRVSDPWGKSMSAASGEPGFTGQWLDAESGLYYNDHRYYDPELGRYISPDPIGTLGGLNEYAYAACPFMGMDPSGLAKALGGGPMDYLGGTRPDGTPDLRGNNGRQVRSRGTASDYPNADQKEGPYGTRTVPSPRGEGDRPDGGGKCLAVTVNPDGSQDAFVSGQGRAPYSASKSPGFPVNPAENGGNYTHAEVQALAHLDQTGVPHTSEPYKIYIDRPCCCQCEGSVSAALEQLRAKGFNVEVHFMKTKGKETEYENFDDHMKAKNGASCS